MRVHDVPYLWERTSVLRAGGTSMACWWGRADVVTSRRPLDVRILIFSSRNFYYALSTHWHIGISCFLPRGIVIQLSVCSNMPAFRHRSPAKWAHAEPLWLAQRVWLGHWRPATSSTSPWALCSPCGGRGPPPRYTSLASIGVEACAIDVSGAVQGRSSAAHRGLERNSFRF